MTEPSTSPPETPPGAGRVVDLRRIPPGVVPRHLQQWALLGTAVVMIGILAVSGQPVKPQRTTAPAPAALAVDPNQQRIEDYQRRIQEQAQRLAAEQAQLQAAKDAFTSADVAAMPRPPVANTPASVAGASRAREVSTEPVRVSDSVAYPHGDSGGAPAAPAPVVPDAAEASPALPLPPALVSPPQPAQPSPSVAPPAAPTVQPSGMTARSVARATAPPSSGAPTYTLFEGTVIETVLTNRLEGTFSGPVNVLVSVPVYAEDQLVIPAGARVLGEARAVNTFGQSRLAVTFHRVLLPNKTDVDLDRVPGLNQAGDLGLADQVNRRYAQIFGASLALGAIAGFAQGQSSVGFDATAFDVYRQGVASSVSQSSARMLDRFLNLLPTVTIREGHRINVYLTRDLQLPAYRPAWPLTGGRP
jgi:type IV secretion system protein VirB10